MAIRFWNKNNFGANMLVVAVATASIFFIACNSRADTSVVLPKSTLALWHLVPDADSVSVTVGDTRITNRIYGQKRADTTFDGGLIPIVVRVNNDTIFSGNTTVVPGTAYTLVIGDSIRRARFFLYQRRTIDTAGNLAGLRFLHASPLVSTTQVTWRDSINAFTNKTYLDFFATPNLFFSYNYLATGIGELAIKPPTSVQAIDSIPATLLAGKNYTLLLLNQQQAPKLVLLPD
jgi:hypothetical protein